MTDSWYITAVKGPPHDAWVLVRVDDLPEAARDAAGDTVTVWYSREARELKERVQVAAELRVAVDKRLGRKAPNGSRGSQPEPDLDEGC